MAGNFAHDVRRRPQRRRHAALLLFLCTAVTACVEPHEYPADPSGNGGGGGGGAGGLYHPAGYAEGQAHGIDTNLQTEDCRDCHGNELTGGTSDVSCDTAGCHSAEWRSDCTYCHGGQTPDGAPPRDIDGNTDLATVSFAPHSAHVTEQNHAPFACAHCHVEPTDILSPGHVFDDTPGRAEVTFAGGLSGDGSYDQNGGCANLYCHGNGRRTGASKRTDSGKTCDSCHADASTPARWGNMSGQHALHLREGIPCTECHSTVVSAPDVIANPSLHVNGSVEYTMAPTGLSESNKTCTGFCHTGGGHFFAAW